MFSHYMTNGSGFKAFFSNFSDGYLLKNDSIARSFVTKSFVQVMYLRMLPLMNVYMNLLYV